MSKRLFATVLLIALLLIAQLWSCRKFPGTREDNMVFKSNLSEYGIYTGAAGSLAHHPAYKPYQLPTPLFSDYAEKQRLLFVPENQELQAGGEGLPVFPDSTILVKTFFYYHNKTDTSLGKRIIETRLLIKHRGQWNAAVYAWNEAQTDASLISAGLELPLSWINEEGRPMATRYHIPAKNECSMCHYEDKNLVPIGLKIRNLNMDITRNGSPIHQLLHLQQEGVLAPMNPADYPSLPAWDNPGFTLEQRARAYLDVNCAHCHYHRGMASKVSLDLRYQTALSQTNIVKKKEAIRLLMAKGVMPLIGTTLVHREGLDLVESYLRTIR